jgi:hypothetical protein
MKIPSVNWIIGQVTYSRSLDRGRARKLLQSGDLTHHQFALLETLLWRCRKAGQAMACASYSSLQRLGHMARETVWAGLARLEELGLVRRVKQRVRVGWVSRQATNCYVFLAPATEFASRTVFGENTDSKRGSGSEGGAGSAIGTDPSQGNDGGEDAGENRAGYQIGGGPPHMLRYKR